VKAKRGSGASAKIWPGDALGVTFQAVPADTRDALRLILDQSFTGIYLWHARRTLRSVAWVREGILEESSIGLTMSTMLGENIGYVAYEAVAPAWRRKGFGSLLLDDVLQFLQARGASRILACVRPENVPSVLLLRSRCFERITFRSVAHSRGFPRAVRLWARMVVAPGEHVYHLNLESP